MVRKKFMLIAGETSGDILAAELVPVLSRKFTEAQGTPSRDLQPLWGSLRPQFFGVGGPQMAEAGVALEVEMTEHAVVGAWEVVKRFSHFLRTFRRLLRLALARQPHAIICVDFSGFNLRFARAVRNRVRAAEGTFGNWRPWMVQYVSPQVWASRPERAERMAHDCDLLLSIIPFEAEWYERHAPSLPVRFVGHPIIDRYAHLPPQQTASSAAADRMGSPPLLVLLPGSRAGELEQHLPVMLEALARIRSKRRHLRVSLVVPNERLAQLARRFTLPPEVDLQTGSTAKVLASADLAIASTGTVTLECAYFGVPTVALYRTSWVTYQIGKRLVTVKFFAMPNLLAGEEVMPEFIQNAATAENLARAALDLLESPERRVAVKAKLAGVVQMLGKPGVSERAADAILKLFDREPRPLRAALG
ncbi:MAG: lipid-A-disaccharide synthase [Verrucomicrobiia bacterium]